MNVLIVDDDTIDAENIQRLLAYSEKNTTTNVATSVDGGIKQYKKSRFDIVLIDCCMPDCDGIEMIVKLREDFQDWSTAIIMMSAVDNDELAVRCLQAGAQDFLPKSEITIGRLHRAIINAQTRNQLQRELRESYDQVKKLAESDALTGLANRYVFDDALQFAIVASKRDSDKKIALLMIDVDKFKFINDTYGHSVGDHVLQSIVQRVKGCLRGGEVFARLGGDEFAIIVSNLNSSIQAGQVAARIRNIMLTPFGFEQCEFNLSVSIGIALYPDNGTVAKDMIQHADIAMYRAKKLGRNRICFYQQEIQASFTDRFLLEKELRQAAVNNQLVLNYLPFYHTQTRKIIGLEALVRWHHPERGVMYPAQFMKIAEEGRQIVTIGRWVIGQSIAQLSKWNKAYKNNWSIAINLSPIQLADKQLVTTIEQLCKTHSVCPELVEFELSETDFFEEIEGVCSNLYKIAALGCRLVLDDFGAGYCAVSHMRDFPISSVKIDRSLFPKAGIDEKNRKLIHGLVLLVHSLGLTTVAEGVETQEHMDLCEELGIACVQGFYFSTPVDSRQIDKCFCISSDQSG